MSVPSEREIQQLFNQAQLASEQAALAAGTRHEYQTEIVMDECWEQYNEALAAYQAARKKAEVKS